MELLQGEERLELLCWDIGRGGGEGVTAQEIAERLSDIESAIAVVEHGLREADIPEEQVVFGWADLLGACRQSLADIRQAVQVQHEVQAA